jgi:hypothetical protein
MVASIVIGRGNQAESRNEKAVAANVSATNWSKESTGSVGKPSTVESSDHAAQPPTPAAREHPSAIRDDCFGARTTCRVPHSMNQQRFELLKANETVVANSQAIETSSPSPDPRFDFSTKLTLCSTGPGGGS